MKSKKLVLMVLLAFLFAPTIVQAAQFQFTPRASASEEYTDNGFLSEDNEREEYITILSPGFTAALLGETNGIEVSYDPAYVFYKNFDENDRWRHYASLFAWSNLTQRTRLEFIDRFLLTEDPLGEEDLIREDDVIIPGDTTARRTRRKYYTHTAIARLTNQFGTDDSIYGEFLYSFLRNDDPQVQDNDRYQPTIGLNYWFGPKFGIETRGVYTKGKFDQDSDFTRTPTDDFDNWFGSLRLINRFTRRFSLFGQYDHIYRDYDGDNNNDYMVYVPSAGFLYEIEEDLSLSLGLGYFYQDIDDEDDEKGAYINSQINKTWSFRRGFISLTGAAGLDQNNFGAENLGLERFASIDASASYNFTRYFLGDISGYYRYSDVINSEAADDIEDENRYRFGAGLGYLPFRWMTLRLNYQFNKLDSDGGDDYDENRVIFSITLQPDQPWRF